MSKHITPAEQEKLKCDIGAGIGIICALADAVKELGQVPNGVLYVNFMLFLSLHEYSEIIEVLKQTGLVEEINNLLCWKGVA